MSAELINWDATQVESDFVTRLGERVAAELDRILTKLGFDAVQDRDWLSENLIALSLPGGESQYYLSGLLILELVKCPPPRYGYEVVSHF